MWQRLIQERSSGYYGRLKKNQEKRPALIFTEGATEVSGSWQNTEWWAAALQTVTISRSGPDTEKHGRLYTVKVHCVNALRVIYQFDALVLLPRQNTVRPVPVGRSLVRCMALNHISRFSGRIKDRLNVDCFTPWQLLCAPHLGYLEHLGSDWHVTMSRSVPLLILEVMKHSAQ